MAGRYRALLFFRLHLYYVSLQHYAAIYEQTNRTYTLTTLLLGRPTLVGKVLTHEIFFFFLIFYQSIVFSSHAVDGHQLYFGGSVVGKASTVGIEISLTPPLIFTGVSAKFGVIFNTTQI